MNSRIAIAISALTLGTVLAAVPSFAQTRDRGSGTAAPAESSSCIYFQQGCSDKPYPMAQGASPNSQQSSGRTGSRASRQARSASSGERINSERTSGTRERVAVGQRNRVSVSGRERLNGERLAARDRGGETFGFGEQRRYYNYEPGMEIAGAPSSAIAWCQTRFRSFDPATGTYMGFDGIRHPCP